jgi:hypothetical protein
MIVTRQAAPQEGDCTVVDPEMHLPYDYEHRNLSAGREPGGDRRALTASASGEAWPMEGHDE